MPIFTCHQIFLNGKLAEQAYVEVEDGTIISTGFLDNLPKDVAPYDLGEKTLAPGFVDIQVNGGAGILFNDKPTHETIHKVAETFRKLGTTALLPTLITDDMEKIRCMANAVETSLMMKTPGILGVHFEGPFLNPDRKGVHDAKYMNASEQEFVSILDEHDLGSVLVTLAPETVSTEFIDQLVKRKITVSAGHTNASYEQICKAAEQGLRGFTHLFNAMPPFLSRDPGVVGAAFQLEDCFSSVIADGHHIHPATLQSALQLLGPERAMLISDAMPCVGSDQDFFHLYGERISVEDGKCVTEDGTLAGSAISIADAVHYCVKVLQLPLQDVLAMSSRTPAHFIGYETAGDLSSGMAADHLILIDSDLTVELAAPFLK
ncbi:N-acetylglucosamine-6-phosphate deacetylase [Sneathiella limimaris]|uniref:N-acetylglucosamine-6-phosphate deacetylase n=1 Tax=Sneathiella limimaris TaxID=1964213 RepID=UPI00146A70A8|nr:N-acetylglucosamine-6-phosphate deacetylase [Sneathiella limimaris]